MHLCYFGKFHVVILINLGFLCPHVKVPYHIDGDQPSYLIIAGLVFTPLSEPLIEYVIFHFLAFQKPLCRGIFPFHGYMFYFWNTVNSKNKLIPFFWIYLLAVRSVKTL